MIPRSIRRLPQRYIEADDESLAAQHDLIRYVVSFNNRLKHGKFPMQSHVAGACASEEHGVALFTRHFHRNWFASIEELRDELGRFGDVRIVRIDE